MKHVLSAALIVLAGGLAGCAGDTETASEASYSFSTGWAAQPRQEPLRQPAVATTGSLQSEVPPPARDQAQRNERRTYAQGLERILVQNGVNISVTVYEGEVGPTPTLMFLGYFSRDFVSRALTKGEVLERARDLGFKSVDFFDRGPEGHYQFTLAKGAPLPKCAAYQRLCL